jgi:tight adherence protein B
MNKVALFSLVAAAFGGVLWVFVYPLLSGERRAAQRQKVIATSNPTVRTANARTQQKARREQIEGSLKELDARKSKNKAPSLPQRIARLA